MAVSITETIGFCDQLVQLLEDNQAALKAKGLDVTEWITDTTSLKNNAVADTAKQDEMQAATKVQTAKAKDSIKLAYKTNSSRLDAVMGVLGKDTPAAKQAGKLRSSLIKQSAKNKPEEPKP